MSGPGYHTRIVATSGAPSYPMVERGEFSDALYYRINMITLRLDEGSEDLPTPTSRARTISVVPTTTRISASVTPSTQFR